MAKIKSLLKSLSPPIIFNILRLFKTSAKIQEDWSGDYSTWAEAQAHCTGYDSNVILEKCKNALLKVKNGEAVYERDSVLFNQIQYSWGLLAGLQKAALENEGKLCVVDFGGSLGSTYFQNKEFLSSLKELKWCIVEQHHFVNCGKEFFGNEQLKFYYTIEECVAEQKPNVLLLSGVLQYLEKPYEWLARFINLKIPYIVIDRTAFIEKEKDILTVQVVPKNIYDASYPAWFFSQNMIAFFTNNYRVLASFDGCFDSPITLNNLYKANWKGFVLKIK